MDLGVTQDDIIKSIKNIITEVDKVGLLTKGPNRIHTSINGYDTEIRLFIDHTGKVLKFNAFKGYSNRQTQGIIVWK